MLLPIFILIITCICIFILLFKFRRQYVLYFVIAEIIFMGFLSFYIFYNLASYESTEDDINMEVTANKTGEDIFLLNIDVKWNEPSSRLKLDGSGDALVIRYDPKYISIEPSDNKYKKSDMGECLVAFPKGVNTKNYKYSKLGKNEKEIGIDVGSREDISTAIKLKSLKPLGEIKVFYIHNYKIPIEGNVYWEKADTISIK